MCVVISPLAGTRRAACCHVLRAILQRIIAHEARKEKGSKKNSIVGLGFLLLLILLLKHPTKKQKNTITALLGDYRWLLHSQLQQIGARPNEPQHFIGLYHRAIPQAI